MFTMADEQERIRRQLLRLARSAADGDGILPGEIEVARRLGATRQQIRHAMAALEHQGVLQRRQGAATVVDPVALRMTVRLEDQIEHAVLLDRLGYDTTVDVLQAGVRDLPADVAADLTPEAGPRAFHVVKRWSADGLPAMLAQDTLALPAGPVPSFDPAESLFDAAERVWGEAVVWEVAVPSAVALDAHLAQCLDQPVGSAFLTIELIGVARSGRRVFKAMEYHRPDIVRYSVVRTLQPQWADHRAGGL